MRRALALPLLLLLLVWGSQNGSAQGPDADGDGVADAADNCAAWPNPDQADADANGVGNACECGDQNGDGVVDVADLVAINLAIFDPARVTALCDASADGRCDVADIIAANAKIFGRPAYCARYPDPAPPDVDGDGDGFTPAEGDCRDGDASVYPNAPVVTGTFGGGNLAPGVCFAARGPDGNDPRSGPDGCSGISVPGVLDANNPAGCADSRFGSGDADQPLPCDLHDACYSTCGTNQALCDLAFLLDMLAVCDSLPPGQAHCAAPCQAAATTYFDAVLLAGEAAWLNNQQRMCECACEAATSACGDGACSLSTGESGSNCPADCREALAEGAVCVVDDDCASRRCGPHGRCTRCGNGICDTGESCRLLSPATCQADCGRCPTGNACASDADCEGFCDALFLCRAKLPNQSACLKDSACQSGACNFGFCVAAASLPALTPCTTSVACRSGSCPLGQCEQICGDGFCDGAEVCGNSNVGLQCTGDCGRCPNGTACAFDAICASNACNFGFCVGAGSVGVGGSCTTANACSNDICQAGCCGRPFTAACTSNNQCCSNRCVTDLLGNRSCALF